MDNLNKRIWMCILHYEWMWICSPVWPIVLVAAIHRHWSLASLQVKHYWMICTNYNLFRSNKIVYITALNSLCLFSETFQLRVWQAVCVPTDLSHFHHILICPRCWLVQRRRQSITEKSNQLISDWSDRIWKKRFSEKTFQASGRVWLTRRDLTKGFAPFLFTVPNCSTMQDDTSLGDNSTPSSKGPSTDNFQFP